MKNTNEFNEQTKAIIKQFIDDLFTILPNLKNKISKMEIEKIIVENLEHNIEFNSELAKGINGQYSLQDKKISISKRISGDEQQKKLTVFHELTHALTASIYTDDLIKNNIYICEVLTTLLEEKYNKEIVKKQTFENRVNGYIPDFGRQLQLVYGDELLEQFIVEPLNLYTIFAGFSSDTKKFLFKQFVKELNLLNYQIKNLEDDSKVKFTVRNIEENIANQLFYKFSIANISENLDVIESLFSSQYYPSFSVFSSMLFRVNDDEFLQDKPILQNLKYIDSIESKEHLMQFYKEISNTLAGEKQIRSIIIQKVFGYINKDITVAAPDLFDFLENEDVYQTIFNLIVQEQIRVDDIENFKFKRCSNSNSKISNKLNRNLIDELLSFNSSKVLFVLFDSTDSIVSIFNEYEFENTKHVSSDIKEVINQPEISSQIISYLNSITETQAISDFFWTDDVQDLEEAWEWEYWDFQMFYRSGINELSQIVVSFDENKNLIFENRKIGMSSSKSLIANADSIGIETISKKN